MPCPRFSMGVTLILILSIGETNFHIFEKVFGIYLSESGSFDLTL
jgi:hypothetical protein